MSYLLLQNVQQVYQQVASSNIFILEEYAKKLKLYLPVW